MTCSTKEEVLFRTVKRTYNVSKTRGDEQVNKECWKFVDHQNEEMLLKKNGLVWQKSCEYKKLWMNSLVDESR